MDLGQAYFKIDARFVAGALIISDKDPAVMSLEGMDNEKLTITGIHSVIVTYERELIYINVSYGDFPERNYFQIRKLKILSHQKMKFAPNFGFDDHSIQLALQVRETMFRIVYKLEITINDLIQMPSLKLDKIDFLLL